MSRRSSSRRGLGKLTKILLLAAVVVGLVFFFWGGAPEDGVESSTRGNADTPPDSLASTDLQSTVPGLVTAPPLLPRGNQTLPTNTRQPITPIQPLPANADNGDLKLRYGSSPGRATQSTIAPGVTPIRTRDTVSPPDTSPAPEQPAADPGLSKAVREMADSMPVPPAPRRFTSGADAATLYNRGDKLIADGNAVEGRAVLSRLLFADNLDLSATDAAAVRQRLTEVNRDLFWSRNINPNDTITQAFKNDGKFLSQIGVEHRVPYQLLEIVNNMDARNLQSEQTIKVVRGPLHARVSKGKFLMDVYAVDPAGMPVYLCSFNVGLGQNTPLGNWQVTKASKVVNPSWKDELNGEFFAADNPENPVGEYWIAIHGLDDSNAEKRGFGIHGTIDPDSIGKEESRGCIRLIDDDIQRVFYMLTDHSQGSTVQIVP